MFSHPKHFRSIYLDHAAATPLHPEVFLAMKPYFTAGFGNPSALYKLGVTAKAALEASRRTVAQILRTQPDTIIFTSGGTEANNLAIFGSVKGKKDHFITSQIEHHSVLYPFKELERRGHKVSYLKVDNRGFVNPADVIRTIRPDTVLISIMYANNEIGAVEPIAEIGRLLLRYRREHNTPYPYFHTDACQAAGYLDLSVEKLHVDLMAINGSKIYGPKGVGLLYVRRGVKLHPLMFGGGQERGLRPGTENVAGIVGLAKALEFVNVPPLPDLLTLSSRPKGRGRRGSGRKKDNEKLRNLTQYFWKNLQLKILGVKLNGPDIGESRLPNNLNFTIPGLDGETLLLYLDAAGISCSTASACEAEAGGTSHVLKAIGRSSAEAKSSLRFTLGRETTKNDINYAVRQICSAVKKLSPE